MICMHAHPDDLALHCLRPATLRFEQQTWLRRVVSGSDTVTTYAYTCEQHKEHGSAIAARCAEQWGGIPAAPAGEPVAVEPTYGLPVKVPA